MCIKPCKKTKVQLLSKATNTKKLKKLEDGMQPPILWINETLFTVQTMHNHRNGKIYIVNKKDIPLKADVFKSETSFFDDLR